jgi:hypothetical protein
MNWEGFVGKWSWLNFKVPTSRIRSMTLGRRITINETNLIEGCGLDVSNSGEGSLTASYLHGNELSGCMKVRKHD